MATLIQIKRSLDTAAPGVLANGEFAYTANGDVLYIGSNDAVVAISGKRVPGTRTANQALVVNATGMIDSIHFGNSTVNAVANQIAFSLANSTISFSLVKPSSVEQGGNYYLKADGSWSTVTGATADPAGANTNIQYNDSGVMNGSDAFTFNETTNTVYISNTFSALNNVLVGDTAVNVVANSTIIRLANSTVTFDVSKPTAAQVSAADYYLASDSTWKQIALSTDLDDLTDVTIATAANNDLLIYDGTAAQWENHAVGNGFTFASQSLAVLAGTNGGLTTNTTGVWVDPANGIIVDSSGVGVNVGTNGGLVSNTTGVWVDAANGITLSADGVNVLGGSTVTVNTTGVHVNSTLQITDLTLSGNLTVSGTLTTIDTANILVEDPLFALAKDQSNTGTFADALDIGFYGSYGNTVQKQYTGFFRDTSESDNRWKLFDATGDFPDPTTTIDTANAAFALANLALNYLYLSTPLAGTQGGTGLSTIAEDSILVANSTNGFAALGLGSEGTVLQSNGTALIYSSLDGGVF